MGSYRIKKVEKTKIQIYETIIEVAYYTNQKNGRMANNVKNKIQATEIDAIQWREYHAPYRKQNCE